MTSIRKYISELNGYLRAISDLNDQVGFRHGYYASYKPIIGADIFNFIETKFGQEAIANLEKSDLRNENKIIAHYALCNAQGARSLNTNDRNPRLIETIVWRIQDYLSFNDYFGEKITERWTTKFRMNSNSYEAIFISTNKHFIWIVFATRKEEITP